MKEKKYTVVGIGEVLWDVFPEERKIGGAPANFSYHAHALGAEGIVVSSIGDDDAGKALQQGLHDKGMDTRYLYISGTKPTGEIFVQRDAAGQPSYDIVEDVA